MNADMTTEPFTYPVRSTEGRNVILALTAAVLAVALGFRYTAVLLPTIAGFVPLLITLCATTLLVGYLSCVLADTGTSPPTPPIRTIANAGVKTLILILGTILFPFGLLAVTILQFTTGGTPNGLVPSTMFLAGSTGAFFLFLAIAYVLPGFLAPLGRGNSLRSTVRWRHLYGLRELAYLGWWAIGFPIVVFGLWLVTVTIESTGVEGIVAALGASYLLLAGTRAIASNLDTAAAD